MIIKVCAQRGEGRVPKEREWGSTHVHLVAIVKISPHDSELGGLDSLQQDHCIKFKGCYGASGERQCPPSFEKATSCRGGIEHVSPPAGARIVGSLNTRRCALQMRARGRE